MGEVKINKIWIAFPTLEFLGFVILGATFAIYGHMDWYSLPPFVHPLEIIGALLLTGGWVCFFTAIVKTANKQEG